MTIIAKYEFPNKDTADKAASRIRDEIGAGAYVSGDRVEINEECRDPKKAAQICLAYGGTPR